MARTRLYREGVLVAEGFPVSEVSEHLADGRSVVWTDLRDPTEADFEAIGAELGLHALAVEDALQRGQRPKLDMNMIMKKVTSWAAIIAVPTAVTGFYGQNVPYPGSGKPWGFVTSTVITVLLSVGLFVVFRRKEWL